MICRKCQNELPAGTHICPVCGMRMAPKVSWRIRLLRHSILATDILAIAMILINAYLLVTAAHYAVDLSHGLWYVQQGMYYLYPSLRIVDIAFGIFLMVFSVLSVMARYRMNQARRRGFVLMIVTHVCLLAWGVGYPLVTYAITGIISPLLTFCLIQNLLFAIVSAIITVYLGRSGRFVF